MASRPSDFRLFRDTIMCPRTSWTVAGVGFRQKGPAIHAIPIRNRNPVLLLRRYFCCLTALRPLTESAEKTAVFHYSKLKQRASYLAGWSLRTVQHHDVLLRPQLKAPLGWHRAGRRAPLSIPCVLAALMFAPALTQQACAQGNPAAAPVTAPAPSSATPPAATSAMPPAAVAAPAASAPPSTSAPATEASPRPAAAPQAPANAMAPAAAASASPNAMAPAAAEPAPGQHMVSAAELPEDLSPWGMFENADLIVKGVIIGLAFASLVTWTVWLAKTLELRGARSTVRRDIRILNGAATFAQAHEQLRDGDSPVTQLMQSAAQEIRLSANLRAEGLKERIALQLDRIEMAVSRKVSRGTGVLATIGSTAPFVGLFGTVWGIMNSFIGISNAHTTNLAVVAPGIAQALLATAFGLVAAIPAVMIYNVLARQTAHYRAYLGDASAQVMRLVSRDLDRAKMPMTQAAE